jgi:hypothetical protein
VAAPLREVLAEIDIIAAEVKDDRASSLEPGRNLPLVNVIPAKIDNQGRRTTVDIGAPAADLYASGWGSNGDGGKIKLRVGLKDRTGLA